MTSTYFQGPKPVRATEVLLYLCFFFGLDETVILIL